MNHSSLRQHAADAENLKKKTQASHFIDSGEQRLSPITGILKQALSCLHAESYWSPMSSVHVLPRDLGCLKLQESGACLGEVPGSSRHSWAMEMKVADVDLILPECTTFKGFEVYSIQEGDPQVVLSLNVWTTWTAGEKMREAESKYVTAIPDDDAILEMNQHERVRVSFATLVLCFNWTPIRRMSINDKNTGFWVRRFSTCKEFMPASSMIFVVLVAYFESTCWKDVSLRSINTSEIICPSLSVYFSMIFGAVFPEGCSKETKCMCTCCPWCFCRVLPSDIPVCHRFVHIEHLEEPSNPSIDRQGERLMLRLAVEPGCKGRTVKAISVDTGE